MTDPDTISADYTLRPSELADTLALLVEARQPAVVWGPPGSAKSDIAQQVAAAAGREYVDVRALLLDPVDLRGIPWRDIADRTRWAPPSFLPPSDDPGRWLINLEELPSALPMVQAALYQLVLDRKCGEYELPEGASLIACGKLRAEIVERSFAHNLDRGGMRRTWLRGRENVHKRYLLHVAGHNLSLLMCKLIGAGTPREAVAGGYGCICVLIAPAGAVLVAQMVLIVSEDGETAFAAICFAVE